MASPVVKLRYSDNLLSEHEAQLLSDISRLQYGELIDVELPSGPRTVGCGLTARQASLIECARAGLQSFRRITVHDGEPVGAEISLRTEGGHVAVKKIRFAF